MQLEALKVFCDLATLRSFSKAADALFVTQPAVSQHVKHLEDALGVSLRLVGTRAFKPTEAGEEVYRLACRLTEDVATTRESLRRQHLGQRSLVTIGSGPTALCHYLPSLLKYFWSTHPEIGVQPVTISGPSEITDMLIECKIDIAIQTSPYINEDLRAIPCINDTIIPVVAPTHPLANFTMVSPPMLAQEKLAVLPTRAESRRMVDNWFRDAQSQPQNLIELGNFDQIRSVAVAGLAVGFVSRYCVLPELRDKRLIEVNTTYRDLRRIIYAVTLPNPRTEVSNFLEVIGICYQNDTFFA